MPFNDFVRFANDKAGGVVLDGFDSIVGDGRLR
jgi:hypothetical protein